MRVTAWDRLTLMATYVLIHGAASDSWYWHRVVPLLEDLGHEVVAPDLPPGAATFDEYADAVVEAIGDRTDLVVVAQSLGGFTGPLVCDRVPADLLVMLAAMVPRPGESGEEWWGNVDFEVAFVAAAAAEGREVAEDLDEREVFFHDVPPEVTEAAFARDEVGQSGGVMEGPWPLPAWPDVPTRVLLCREDRFFPADLQRRIAADRLGLVPDEMAGGHLPALARPDELVAHLEQLRTDSA